MARGVRKQAMVPEGAHVLEPVGTAPGLVVPSAQGPAVLVLPGPPGELRPMWEDAVVDGLVLAALAGREELRQRTVRIWGPPEAELAEVLRTHEAEHGLEGLEVTTCLREGELEVVTRFAPAVQEAYDRLEATLVAAFADAVYSTDGRTVDEVVFDLFGSTGATLAPPSPAPPACSPAVSPTCRGPRPTSSAGSSPTRTRPRPRSSASRRGCSRSTGR